MSPAQPRDRRAEATRLVHAAQATGAGPLWASSFTARVLARLDAHGQHIAPGRTPAGLLAEISEEAADIAGWSVLAAQHPGAASLLPTLDELMRLGAIALAVCDDAERP